MLLYVITFQPFSISLSRVCRIQLNVVGYHLLHVLQTLGNLFSYLLFISKKKICDFLTFRDTSEVTNIFAQFSIHFLIFFCFSKGGYMTLLGVCRWYNPYCFYGLVPSTFRNSFFLFIFVLQCSFFGKFIRFVPRLFSHC